MRHSTPAEAHQTIAHLRQAHQQSATTEPLVLLFGIHQRAFRIGRFEVGHTELRLQVDAQCIVTTDRRLHSTGTAAAVYCNCSEALPLLIPDETVLRIGGGGGGGPEAGTAVQLLVRRVVRDSIVCTVQRPGRRGLRPGDRVQMEPLKTYANALTAAERSDIDVAVASGAHVLLVPTDEGGAEYHASLVKYLASVRGTATAVAAAAADEPQLRQRLHIMLRLSGVETNTAEQQQQQLSKQRAKQIANTYDGVCLTLHHRHCVADAGEPIVPGTAELVLMHELSRLHKPLVLMAGLSRDGHTILPANVSAEHPECVHADAFLVGSECLPVATGDSDSNSTTRPMACRLSEFRKRLRQGAAHTLAVNRRVLHETTDAERTVDRTRSGRLVLTHNAVLAAYAMHVRAIIVATRTGVTALELAARRPPCRVLALVSDRRVCDAMQLRRTISAVWSSRGDGPSQHPNDIGATAKWRRRQAVRHLHAMHWAAERNMLVNTDYVIMLCKAQPASTACDTMHICTVLQFVQWFERTFGVAAAPPATDAPAE